MNAKDNLKQRLDVYLAENLVEEDFSEPPPKLNVANKFRVVTPSGVGLFAAAPLPSFIDFEKVFARNEGETFSEMLTRLIKESGEKNSVIYDRAQIDRKHFSKIKNKKDYQPSRDTAIALAMALKLDFEKAKNFIASAGYTLSKSKRDLIISFFIQNKIFDTYLLNDYLYEYNQPLLFGK